jgi:hypothetical protein
MEPAVQLVAGGRVVVRVKSRPIAATRIIGVNSRLQENTMLQNILGCNVSKKVKGVSNEELDILLSEVLFLDHLNDLRRMILEEYKHRAYLVRQVPGKQAAT